MIESKKRNKNRQKKNDKIENVDNIHKEEITKRSKKEDKSTQYDISFNKDMNIYIDEGHYMQSCIIKELESHFKDEEGKNNVYYIYEELKINKNISSKIYYYTWFYYFENMILKLDNFLDMILNYSYYLLNDSCNKERIFFLIETPLKINIHKCIDSTGHITINFKHKMFKNIEKIISEQENNCTNKKKRKKNKNNYDNTIDQNCESILNNENINSPNKSIDIDVENVIEDDITNVLQNEKEDYIINFLKHQKIKSILYINDIFEPEHLSILFLIHTEIKSETINCIGKTYTDGVFNDEYLNKSDYNEFGILKGYDIILLRYSYEVIYFYKEDNTSLFSDYNIQKSDDKDNERKNSYPLNYNNNEIDNLNNQNDTKNFTYNNNSSYYEKILNDKNKYHIMLTWKPHLKYVNNSTQIVLLDALNISSGMDGYIDDKNFNFDVLVNDEYSYLVQYKTKISISRLIYAVTSLIQKKLKPMVYVPHWWYNEIAFCENNLDEPANFQLYVLNELKKDGLLKIGYRKISSRIFTMNHKDIDFIIKLAMKHDAILCSNNNDIIKYYLEMNENAKVSKFISKGTFFVLTNYL
ncbi:conserved Plasmodium protein, unknown function [Plasmodium gaboni]|uniref:PIN domain-containing protein n=1 Tax=Plasmodium gaboni TaxID=647221 RepID=A0ABY1UPN8_9APIC|nr:conserved Plasmodium protein, unknown function [Plasmodium gaboni]